MNCAKRENIFLMICFVQLDFQAMIFALEVKPARFFLKRRLSITIQQIIQRWQVFIPPSISQDQRSFSELHEQKRNLEEKLHIQQVLQLLHKFDVNLQDNISRRYFENFLLGLRKLLQRHDAKLLILTYYLSHRLVFVAFGSQITEKEHARSENTL